MSKVNADIVAKLGSVSFNKTGGVILENPKAVSEHIKEVSGVNDEQLVKLHTAIADTSAAVTKHVGDAIIVHLKENPDLSLLDFRVDSGLLDIGVSVARPTATGSALNKEHVKAGIASYVSFKGLDKSHDVIEELADAWLAV